MGRQAAKCHENRALPPVEVSPNILYALERVKLVKDLSKVISKCDGVCPSLAKSSSIGSASGTTHAGKSHAVAYERAVCKFLLVANFGGRFFGGT